MNTEINIFNQLVEAKCVFDKMHVASEFADHYI